MHLNPSCENACALNYGSAGGVPNVSRLLWV